MDFERVAKHTGHLCPYIVFSVSVISCFGLLLNIQNAITNFLVPNLDHWCHIPSLQNVSHDQQKYIGIPYDFAQKAYQECLAYDIDWDTYSTDELENWNWTGIATDDIQTAPCQNGWTYEDSTFATTVTAEWDLVCDRVWIRDIVSPVYLTGMLLGSLLSGPISDNYGRMKTLVVFCALCVSMGIGVVFSVNEWMYIAFRFFMGIAARASGLCSIVIAMEIVAPGYRSLVVGVARIFYSSGLLVLAAVGYFIRDFRTLQLVLVLPLAALIPVYWLIPESPRWLVSKGRMEEAKQSVLTLARRARARVSSEFLLQCMETQEGKDETTQKKHSSNDLFRQPVLRKWTLIIGFAKLAAMMVYMAVSLNLDGLSGDIYINVALAAVTEIPSVVIIMYCSQQFGRKISMQVAFCLASLGGILSTIFTLIDVDPMANTVTLILVRCAVGAAACASTTLSAELFPSYMRQTAVSGTNAISSVFAIFAPLVGGPLKEVWLPLPSVVFTTLCVMTVALNTLIPETLGKPMPESVEEALNLARPATEKEVDSKNYEPTVKPTKEDLSVEIRKAPGSRDFAGAEKIQVICRPVPATADANLVISHIVAGIDNEGFQDGVYTPM